MEMAFGLPPLVSRGLQTLWYGKPEWICEANTIRSLSSEGYRRVRNRYPHPRFLFSFPMALRAVRLARGYVEKQVVQKLGLFALFQTGVPTHLPNLVVEKNTAMFSEVYGGSCRERSRGD